MRFIICPKVVRGNKGGGGGERESYWHFNPLAEPRAAKDPHLIRNTMCIQMISYYCLVQLPIVRSYVLFNRTHFSNEIAIGLAHMLYCPGNN